MSPLTQSQWQLANAFPGHQFFLKVAFERIGWVPTGLKHKHSEAACVQQLHNLLIQSRGKLETEDYVSKETEARGLKKQQEKRHQHNIKAYQLSGFCSWCHLLWLENQESICLSKMVLHMWQFGHRTLFVKMSYTLHVTQISVGLNSNWSYIPVGTESCNALARWGQPQQRGWSSHFMLDVGLRDECIKQKILAFTEL